MRKWVIGIGSVIGGGIGALVGGSIGIATAGTAFSGALPLALIGALIAAVMGDNLLMRRRLRETRMRIPKVTTNRNRDRD